MDLLWISKQYYYIKPSIYTDEEPHKLSKVHGHLNICNDLMHTAKPPPPKPPSAPMFPSLLCIYDVV